MSDVRELLPLYALGVLDADEVRQVERAVAADPALAAELAAYADAAALIAAPVQPSPDVKTRLLASVAGRHGRDQRSVLGVDVAHAGGTLSWLWLCLWVCVVAW